MAKINFRNISLAVVIAAVMFNTGCGAGSGDDTLGSGSSAGTGNPGQTNRAPVVTNEQATINQAGSLVDLNVLQNDIDPEGQPLSLIDAISQAGQVTFDSRGLISFVPNNGVYGNVEIQYWISDGSENSKGIVTVNIIQRSFNITINWEAPSQRVNGGKLSASDDIVEYVVAYKESEWNDYIEQLVMGNSTSLQISDVESGTYSVKVAAVDFLGNMSDYSDAFTVDVGN